MVCTNAIYVRLYIFRKDEKSNRRSGFGTTEEKGLPRTKSLQDIVLSMFSFMLLKLSIINLFLYLILLNECLVSILFVSNSIDQFSDSFDYNLNNITVLQAVLRGLEVSNS
jgi:hypothetical protein